MAAAPSRPRGPAFWGTWAATLLACSVLGVIDGALGDILVSSSDSCVGFSILPCGQGQEAVVAGVAVLVAAGLLLALPIAAALAGWRPGTFAARRVADAILLLGLAPLVAFIVVLPASAGEASVWLMILALFHAAPGIALRPSPEAWRRMSASPPA